MGGDKTQPKHTKMNPIGAKAELGLAVLCAGDRKTSVGCDFPHRQKLCRKWFCPSRKSAGACHMKKTRSGKNSLIEISASDMPVAL